MTAGWISPRWVPLMVYVVVLAAGLYYAAMDLGGSVPVDRVAGFAAAMTALLGVEAADRRWLGRPGPGRAVLGLLSVRIALFVAAAALDPSGDARLLFVLVPFAAYFAFGAAVSLALGGACLAVVVAGFALRVPRWYAQPTDVSDVLMFAVGLVLAIAMASIAVAEQAGRLRLEAVLGDLRDSHDQLRAYAAQVAGLSAAAERGRLARDIHDSLGHHLTAVTVQLEKAEAFRHLDAASADRAVADARAAARQALREVRGSVAALRGDEPPLAALRDDEPPAPLSAMLAGLVPAGPGEPQVTVTVAGDEAALGAAVRTVLFRAAQEALTNVRRHSGARRVRVSVTLDDRAARLVVADDGRGFDPASRVVTGGLAREGFGLLGMRERAALAGGHAVVDSRPGAGTTVTVTVPVEAAPVAPVAAAPAPAPAAAPRVRA
jgi:signal transduction histidine kinase